MKRCTERVVFSFKCRKEQVQFGGIFSQPAKLCEIIKSAIKEISFGKIINFIILFHKKKVFFAGFIKCITLFDLFAFRQDKLSKIERHEIIKEVKQRFLTYLTD
jgi:hypothetical protein